MNKIFEPQESESADVEDCDSSPPNSPTNDQLAADDSEVFLDYIRSLGPPASDNFNAPRLLEITSNARQHWGVSTGLGLSAYLVDTFHHNQRSFRPKRPARMGDQLWRRKRRRMEYVVTHIN